MTGRLRLQTVVMMWWCALLIVVQSGCATHRATPQPNLQLGKVGIVSARYTPAFEFALPSKGWLGGAADGTKAFIVLVPPAAIVMAESGGVTCCTFDALFMHGFLDALWTAGALIKGAGYMIVGPFYGSGGAEAPATVEEAEVHLKTALRSMRIQETMRDHVVQATQFLANRDVRVLEGQGPESSSNLLTYFPIQDPSIETILELRVNRVWLSANEPIFEPVTSMIPSDKPKNKASQKSGDPINPNQGLQNNSHLSLGMEVRSRLIRTPDKVVLYDNTWQHEGGLHLFAEWAANDAYLFVKEFEGAYDAVARELVPAIF